MNKKKKIIIGRILPILIIILIVGGVLYYIYKVNRRQNKSKVSPVGMATKTEVENIEAFDLIGEWTQGEINYFQNKEYMGDKKSYILFSLHYYPPYIKERLLKEDSFNSIAYEKDIITETAMKQFASLSSENKQLLRRYFILLKSEIYARHGYNFKNLDLKRFFEMMPWYSQSPGKIEISDKEKYNIKRIEEREKLLEDINFEN